MKLTKEECIKALDILKEQHDYLSFVLHSNYPYSIEMIKIVQSCFEQLINEHFNNNMTTTWHNMVNEVDKLDREIELLKRENKALAEDNEIKCEEISKLKKRIERLIEIGHGLSDSVDELTEEKERLERMLETFK